MLVDYIRWFVWYIILIAWFMGCRVNDWRMSNINVISKLIRWECKFKYIYIFINIKENNTIIIGEVVGSEIE